MSQAGSLPLVSLLQMRTSLTLPYLLISLVTLSARHMDRKHFTSHRSVT